jgi:hypothetical protein
LKEVLRELKLVGKNKKKVFFIEWAKKHKNFEKLNNKYRGLNCNKLAKNWNQVGKFR